VKKPARGRQNMWKALVRLLVGTAAVVLLSFPALAQCPLCRTAASAQDESARTALDLAIIVLFVPAISMFCGVYYVTFRYRDPQGEVRPVDASEAE
jgi:hypothetical protein